MGYALFANRKLMLTSQLNGLNLQLAQRSTEQYNLACQTASLEQQLMSINSSQNNQLRPLYEEMAEVNADGTMSAEDAADARTAIQSRIQGMQLTFENETNEMQRRIDEVGLKEEAFELQKKNLESRITVVQNELKQVEEAEAQGIQNATPKYKGLG